MICSLSFSLNTGDRPANKSVSHATSALFRMPRQTAKHQIIHHECAAQPSLEHRGRIHFGRRTTERADKADRAGRAGQKQLANGDGVGFATRLEKRVFLQRRPRPSFAVEYSCLDKAGPSRYVHGHTTHWICMIGLPRTGYRMTALTARPTRLGALREHRIST